MRTKTKSLYKTDADAALLHCHHTTNNRRSLSLSDVGEQVQHALVLLLAARLAEHIPEAQRLVARPRHDRLAVRTERQIQHTVRVARQLGHLRQRRILPHQDLVLRVAVRRHQLRRVLRPRQIAHLRSGVDALHRLAGQRVPEADAAVGGAAAAGQQTVMVRRPGDRLDGGHVLGVRLNGTERVLVPHVQPVVVAAARQILVVR